MGGRGASNAAPLVQTKIMAYGNPGNPGPAGGMMAGGMEGDEAPGTIHIGPDMLPKGMKLNKGDIVEFKVIGDQDADGDWPIEYNYGDSKGAEGAGGDTEEGETTSWEDDFRKHMSPQSGGGESQQEAQ